MKFKKLKIIILSKFKINAYKMNLIKIYKYIKNKKLLIFFLQLF